MIAVCQWGELSFGLSYVALFLSNIFTKEFFFFLNFLIVEFFFFN